MLPKSLKGALLIAVAALVLISGGAVSQLVAHRYGAILLRTAAARAENIAHKLALEAADQILINDKVALQRLLDNQVAGDSTVAYVFIVRQGMLLSHTFMEGVPFELIEANSPLDSENPSIAKIMSQEGDRYLDIAFPIFGGKAGTLRMGFSEAPYRRQVSGLWLEMSMITLGILILMLLISHWVVSRLTRPLLSLTRYAAQIDEGSLDHKIRLKGSQEVSQLAAAFNSMLDRLQEYTRKLQDSNAHLERKNQELDRAHAQLKTSFSISQKIAALPRLDQICRFLIHALREIVECREIILLVFNSAARTINLATPRETLHLGQEIYDDLHDTFDKFKQIVFLNSQEFGRLQLPEPLVNADQIAVFPIWHHNLMLGAMVVGCPGNCQCVRSELDIISIILHQAAGAFHRANVHEEELRELRQRVDAESGFGSIVGKDPKMQTVFKLIEDVAPTDATVIIYGESGTGKELVARAIHDRSHRAQNPFVVINCTAYPSTLLESELFGYEKGAFTGAIRRKIGRFEQADGGTAFLDEIGEIEPAAQVKLLRVLQQQTIDRLGGYQSIKVNVRILAASNKSLIEEVQKGHFREDLFYRLNVIPIQLPPLRDRRQDIYLLANHFLKRFVREQKKHIKGFRSDAMRFLMDHPWPGNVRELENSIEHAVVLTKSDQVELHDLPLALHHPSTEYSSPIGRSILKSEEKLIREVLEECDWNKTEAARRLGISRSTLYEKLKKLQIVPPTMH